MVREADAEAEGLILALLPETACQIEVKRGP
jgi:hypothetical protein